MSKVADQISQKIMLGGATLGGFRAAKPLTEFDQLSLVGAAFSHGIKLFDIAPDYGRGYAEKGLANAIMTLNLGREDYGVQSKVLRKISQSNQPYREPGLWQVPAEYEKLTTDWDLSYDGTLQIASDSRDRLHISRHEGLALHDPQEAMEQKGISIGDFQHCIRALRELKANGQLLEIGMGTKTLDGVQALIDRFPGVFDYVMLMNYNLLDHSSFLSKAPFKDGKREIKIVLAGPFASGILANPPTTDATLYYRTAEAQVLERYRKIWDVAMQCGMPNVKSAALQFVLSQGLIAKMVIGARDVKELHENIANLSVEIPTRFWKTLKDENLIDQRAAIPCN